MLTVDLTIGALVYIFSALFLFLGLWFYCEWRDRNFYERERKKVIFHCIKCDKIYTRKQGTEVARCPRCSFRNARLKF